MSFETACVVLLFFMSLHASYCDRLLGNKRLSFLWSMSAVMWSFNILSRMLR